jgi:hypothetical protein
MKVKGVILYPQTVIKNPLEILNHRVGEESFLSWQVKELRASGRNPIVVLGKDGDDLLTSNPILADCDLSFSVESDFSPLAALKAGLEAAGTSVFALNLWTPAPNLELWSKLENELGKIETPHDIHFLRTKSSDSVGHLTLLTQPGQEHLKSRELENGELFEGNCRIFEVEDPSANVNLTNTSALDEWFNSWGQS